MPCCGMKAHWIVGTIINIFGLLVFSVGVYFPSFTHIHGEVKLGMVKICYVDGDDMRIFCSDIADKPFYGMSSKFWRAAHGLGSAGIALNVYGSVLFQIFQFGNVNTMLPVPVCFVLAGSILTTASTVVFQHNSEMYVADYMVTNDLSLFASVLGSLMFLISGFVLMASTIKKIKKSRKLNRK